MLSSIVLLSSPARADDSALHVELHSTVAPAMLETAACSLKPSIVAGNRVREVVIEVLGHSCRPSAENAIRLTISRKQDDIVALEIIPPEDVPREEIESGLLAIRLELAKRLTETPNGNEPSEQPHEIQVGIAATASLGDFRRSVGSPDAMQGAFLSGTARVHFLPFHGVFASVGVGGAVFGPGVVVVEGGYSFRIAGSSAVRGVTGALYADVGPAFATVSNASGSNVFGGRIGLVADVHLWNFLLGVEAVYRGGAATSGPSQWNGLATIGLRLGVIFGIPRAG